jgi:hypothetical protein
MSCWQGQRFTERERSRVGRVVSDDEAMWRLGKLEGLVARWIAGIPSNPQRSESLFV